MPRSARSAGGTQLWLPYEHAACVNCSAQHTTTVACRLLRIAHNRCLRMRHHIRTCTYTTIRAFRALTCVPCPKPVLALLPSMLPQARELELHLSRAQATIQEQHINGLNQEVSELRGRLGRGCRHHRDERRCCCTEGRRPAPEPSQQAAGQGQCGAAAGQRSNDAGAREQQAEPHCCQWHGSCWEAAAAAADKQQQQQQQHGWANSRAPFQLSGVQVAAVA
ncbi:hypothetical protein COO60DRAFT_1536254, partial [Scenedesmus sp. NREL 46B-D3]